jgi:hypothetical protein
MNGAVIFVRRSFRLRRDALGNGAGVEGLARGDRFACLVRFGCLFVSISRGGLGGMHRPRTGRILRHVVKQGAPVLLAARRRYLRLFVLVIGVAGRAAGLLDLVLNHRHDDVIRNAPLTRTIVVQNVTEPKPALLHELPRALPFRWDAEYG